MVNRGAAGRRGQHAEGVPMRSRPKRNPRELLSCEVKSRGGPEAWVEIRARGAILRVPGYVTIAEVVRKLNGLG